MELSRDEIVDRLRQLEEKWSGYTEYDGQTALGFLKDVELLLEQIDADEED